MVVFKNIICSHEKLQKITIGVIFQNRIWPFSEDFENFHLEFLVIFEQRYDIFRLNKLSNFPTIELLSASNLEVENKTSKN